MISEQEKFNLYLTVLRFLPFKITKNLRRIYLDFDMNNRRMVLTAFYESLPTELENELLDKEIILKLFGGLEEFKVYHKTYKENKRFTEIEKTMLDEINKTEQE